MNTEEIIEGNKLIAVFDGKEIFNRFGASVVEKMKYHSSFDWLMPVCKKLDYLTEDNIIPHTKDYEHFCDKMDDAVTRTYEILPVFKVVVDFIQWYNIHYPQK